MRTDVAHVADYAGAVLAMDAQLDAWLREHGKHGGKLLLSAVHPDSVRARAYCVNCDDKFAFDWQAPF